MARAWRLLILSILAWVVLPSSLAAQSWPSLGGRALSRDGKWLLPVANPVLSSDEDDHLRRGSVDAWDLTEPLGTPVYPMAAGRVDYAGCNNAGGYGCWALIQHEDGYSSIYAHMLDEGGGTIWVKAGQQVTAWTVLGRVGWTGQTSFGPHVHWEIRHIQEGRLRNDLFFSRSAVPYCKFCAATADQAQTLPSEVSGVAFVTNRLFSVQALLGLMIVALAILLFFRPGMAIATVHFAGRSIYRLLNAGAASASHRQGRRTLAWVHLGVVLVAPAMFCGSATAFAVWMADEGVKPQALMDYWRYGVYPLMGGGYQSGAKYSAVWGMPCSGVGTLGKRCSADEIIDAGVAWQQEISSISGIQPAPVVIPRLGGRFSLSEARTLLTAMHQRAGLVIVDTNSDYALARQAIDELTPYGLDGVAIDLEFVKQAQISDVQELAQHLADQRKESGLKGEGVLVLWNVFHNLDAASKLSVTGVRIVPIFTGYGSTATKVAGLQRTQQIFAVRPADSGLMAFDNRWPVNISCRGFDTRSGYDCQNWVTLFADPTARQVGWWVQQ